MGWASQLPSELRGNIGFYGIPRVLIVVLFAIVLGASMNSARSQDVWFPWLDHVQKIQSQWTATQEEAFGIWNNITRFQNFKEYERQLSEVLVIVDSMDKQRVIDKSRYAQTYQTFFEISDEYVLAMRRTITQLELVLGKLKEKSESLDAYSLHQYQQDLERYNELLKGYRTIGQKMNVAFQKIQAGI